MRATPFIHTLLAALLAVGCGGSAQQQPGNLSAPDGALPDGPTDGGGGADIGAEESIAEDASPLCSTDGGVRTLVTGPQGAQRIAVDTSYVYWVNSTGSLEPGDAGPGGQIMKCETCGCAAPTVLATGTAPGAIAVGSTNVYWADGNIMTVPIDGGPATVLAGAEARDIALDANAVYWTDRNAIMKVPLGGGAPVELVGNQPNPGALAVDGAYVYWGDASLASIQRVGVTGVDSPVTLAQAVHPSDIAAGAGVVFWLDVEAGQKDSTVLSVSAGGSPVVVASGFDGGSNIALDSSFVSWTSSYAVMAADRQTGAVVTVYPSAPTEAPYGVALDGSDAYWTDFISGSVMRAALP
jgi:hypothetical protein